MESNPIIVFHRQNDFARRLKFCVSNTITIVEKQKMRLLIQEVRMNPISCVILYAEHEIPEKDRFERFKEQFPQIPCIAVLGSQNMELARYCGTVGIECVLSDRELDRLEAEIIRICAEKNDKVSLQEVGIDKTKRNYSTKIKEALDFMEKQYRKILNTNEVANQLEISESTLSREFAKVELPRPKKVLILLKIHHAIKLMRNTGLNIQEIALMSGFTEEKRMAECFHRMFGLPPGEYRLRNINKLNLKSVAV
jgi:AraC-like DNA-binding protein